MTRSILAAAMVSLFAGSALAADLPARMPVKAPIAVPYYNWTGFYVGLNAGGAFGRLSQSGAGSSDSMNGFAGGAQLGYNWQINNIVLGLETDFQGSSQKLSEAGVDPVLGAFTASARLNYFGTIRARLGLAQDRWLAYITGGYAYQNVKFDMTSAVFGAGSASSTRGGWTVGGGLEYAFAGPWTAGIEYLYLDSGNRDWNFAGNIINLRARNHVVRAKVNYRF
ncbi:MAG: outer membrane protein [Pseudolabrys sp.]